MPRRVGFDGEKSDGNEKHPAANELRASRAFAFAAVHVADCFFL